jgi:hypothetical protein
MNRKHKAVLGALLVAGLMIGSILSIMFVYGAETINMEISGDNSAERFTASLTADTFIDDTISFGSFSYNWATGINNGEILIHTVKGLLTIKMSQGTYDDVTRTFTIPKFTVEYPQNYPYTITIDRIIGSYDTSTFTCFMVGRYTEGSGSSSGSTDCTGECYDVDCECDSDSVMVDLYLDKEATSATITFRGGDNSKYASMSGSNRSFYYDLAVASGTSPPSRFTIEIYYKDGTRESTDSYTISCGGSSGDNTWTGGTTTNDYTTALAEAKTAGFTTVGDYIADMKKKVADMATTMADRTTLLTTRNAEIETLKSDKTSLQNQLNNQQNTYNSYVQTHSYTNDQYNQLLTGKTATGTGTSTMPEIPESFKQYIGLGLLALIGGGIYYKKYYKKKKKFDPHEYQEEVRKNGNGDGIPKNGTKDDEQGGYVIRNNGRPTREEILERMQKIDEEFAELEKQVKEVEQ